MDEKISINKLITMIQPGDFGLTTNPGGKHGVLGKAIRWATYIEEGDGVEYGHGIVFAKQQGPDYTADGSIYESVMKIEKNHIRDYVGSKICIFRHVDMTEKAFFEGREEILDNIGMIYPFHRLPAIMIDMVIAYTFRKFFKTTYRKRLIHLFPMDWPVCTELMAQFIFKSGLETGLKFNTWKGTTPDHWDDTRKNRFDLYQSVEEGVLI